MAVSPEDVHLVVVDGHTLPITRAGLLSDNISMAVIINNLLLDLFLAGLLVSD
jgi:hypothetical protein